MSTQGMTKTLLGVLQTAAMLPKFQGTFMLRGLWSVFLRTK